MIVALFGTNPYPFLRLKDALSDYLQERPSETLFAQLGHTPGSIKGAVCVQFCPREQILAQIANADVVVAQGGFGSLGDALKTGIPVVAVPRLGSMGECQDDQVELVNELERLKLVSAVYDISYLPEAIAKAKAPENLPSSQIPKLGRVIKFEVFIGK